MGRSKAVQSKNSFIVSKSALDSVNNCLTSMLDSVWAGVATVTSVLAWATMPWMEMTCLPSIKLWGWYAYVADKSLWVAYIRVANGTKSPQRGSVWEETSNRRRYAGRTAGTATTTAAATVARIYAAQSAGTNEMHELQVRMRFTSCRCGQTAWQASQRVQMLYEEQ